MAGRGVRECLFLYRQHLVSRKRLWASLDTRYSFRGSTRVNGVDQNNSQRNFILATEVNISLNARNSLVLEFGKAVVHRNGPSVVAFSVKYDYTWGTAYW